MTTSRPAAKHSKELVIGFLGLDGSGKTTILKALQGEGAESVHPTMGFSRGEFAANRCKIVAYDLGGAERIRDIWKIYYAEVHLRDRLRGGQRGEFADRRRTSGWWTPLREHPDLMFKPILFLLNKKDLPEAMDEMAFSEHFALHTMACDNKTDIRVEGVCAVKGHGKDIDPMINEGIHWLIERVMARYEQLHKEIDLAEKRLKERQARERLERQHRLARLANHNSKDEPTEETVEMAEIPNGPSTSHQAAAPVANGVLRSSRQPPRTAAARPVDQRRADDRVAERAGGRADRNGGGGRAAAFVLAPIRTPAHCRPAVERRNDPNGRKNA
ncbi:hypothetical protein M3Y99_01377600 [Aphelenchoides fujianensis]|nr:hypothetical protein M3Y99_01377600 [Aphelenchoides fujianensis]